MEAAKKDFINKINDWSRIYLNKNTEIILDETFYYNHTYNVISIATNYNGFPPQFPDWVSETLTELGLLWKDLPWPLLAFLHEAGHSQTLKQYSDEEIRKHHFEKIFISLDSRYTKKEQQKAYWRVEDELAANTWAVNFANTHIKAIEELTNIFFTYCYWNDTLKEV